MITFLSNFLVKSTLLGILLWLVLWTLKKVLFQWYKQKKINKKLRFYFPLIQSFIWILFACYLAWHFSKYDSLAFFTSVTAFLFLGRSFLQNLFMGIFFRLEKQDLRGVSLRIGKKEGIVVSYGITRICVKSADGSRNYVPYEELYRQTYVHTVKMEQTDELQTLKIELPENVLISEEVRERIRMKILLNPYVATNENIDIWQGKTDEDRFLLLNYNLVNPERSDAIKVALQKEILRELKIFENTESNL